MEDTATPMFPTRWERVKGILRSYWKYDGKQWDTKTPSRGSWAAYLKKPLIQTDYYGNIVGDPTGYVWKWEGPEPKDGLPPKPTVAESTKEDAKMKSILDQIEASNVAARKSNEAYVASSAAAATKVSDDARAKRRTACITEFPEFAKTGGRRTVKRKRRNLNRNKRKSRR